MRRLTPFSKYLASLLPLVALVVAGCPYGRSGDRVSAPENVVPLDGVNSPWDDFNASMPQNWQSIVYSTNRGSEGRHLDVWEVEVEWGPKPTAGTIGARPFSPALMSEGNERGPLMVTVDKKTPSGYLDRTQVFVVASDRPGGKGGFDLYMAENCEGGFRPCKEPLVALDGLNSPSNEMYLTLPYGGRRALFASDREGAGYDIFEAEWAPGRSLSEPPQAVRRVAELSGGEDDTAPYVDTLGRADGTADLVFASKRAGGQGAYDLWCSRFEGGKWLPPVSLGPAINSPHDEFRPSVFTVSGSTFLLFSSNRPGGAGGYDLYTVKYPGCPAR